MFKGKLLKKLILISIILITLYTVTIVVMWLRSDLVIKSAEFDDNNTETVEAISNDFDENLTRIISLGEKLGEEEAVVKFATVNDGESHGYSTMAAVDKIGETVDNFSNPDCMIGVFSANKSTVALPSTSIDVERFSNFFGINQDSLEDIYRYFAGSKSTRTLKIYDKPLNENADGDFLVFFNKRVGNSDFLVAIMTNGDYLFGNIGDNHLSCIVNGNTVLTHGSEDIDYMTYISTGQNSYRTDSASFADVQFVLCSRNYMYIKDNYKLLASILTAGILLLVIIIIILMLTIKRVYKPIGMVVDQIKAYSNVDDNDEAYIVGSNFESMLKRNEELIQKMSSVDVHMREKALKDILNGVVNAEKTGEYITSYGLEMLNENVTVTVIELITMDNLKNVSVEAETADIKNQIFKTIREQINFDVYSEHLRINEDRSALLSVGCDERNLRETLANEMSIVEAYYGVTFKTSTGSTGATLYDARNSYLEAISMLELQKTDGKSFVNKANFSLDEFFYYPLDVENTLISCVRQGDSEKTALLLENIVRKNYSVGMSEALLSEFRLSLVVTLKRLLQISGKSGSVDYAENTDGEEEFLQWITGEFLKLISDSADVNVKNSSRLLAQITDYIKENYTRDISLTDISLEYDISQGYIGKLFRENMNTTFKDYLNRYRIGIAKEMIQSDINVKIIAVAEAVGFTNGITFNRVFRKYEGVSPSEYRDSLVSGAIL